MYYAEYPDTALVNVGDVVRADREEPQVIFSLTPGIHTAAILRNDDGSFERIAMPGTYLGPLEVIGRISIDDALEGFAKSWPEEAVETIMPAFRAHLEADYEAGPVEVKNNPLDYSG